MPQFFASKDPDEVLDYSWPVPLDDGDTVVEVSITKNVVVAAGVTLTEPTLSGKTITVFASGGTVGQTLVFQLRASTAAGRTFEQSFIIAIESSAVIADPDIATLAKLKAAYDRLIGGESFSEVRDQNGEMVRYTQGSAPRLLLRIRELEFKLGSTGTSGPMRLVG